MSLIIWYTPGYMKDGGRMGKGRQMMMITDSGAWRSFGVIRIMQFSKIFQTEWKPGIYCIVQLSRFVVVRWG